MKNEEREVDGDQYVRCVVIADDNVGDSAHKCEQPTEGFQWQRQRRIMTEHGQQRGEADVPRKHHIEACGVQEQAERVDGARSLADVALTFD